MNIIFETQFGSQIYGTSTPQSDIDYKGIYQADYSDIVLSRAKESITTTTKEDKRPNVRNKPGDVDREYKELRRFIKDALAGQTYALDMLYVPEKHWIHTSLIWEEIVSKRHLFLSKNMAAFIGYIRQQTGKYAMKGTRMDAVVETIKYLNGCNPKSMLIDVWDDMPKSEFVYLKQHKVTVNYAWKEETMLEVLGKMFAGNVPVSFPLEVLGKFEKEFGSRSRAAMLNQDVDWKAVSHAYRACFQLLDIANEGQIIFPLTQAKYILKVKNGEVSYKDIVQHELPRLMSESIAAIEQSPLPEQAPTDVWDDFIIEKYKK